MCASCIFLLLILVLCVLRMSTDGLPINRRELGVHQDIIAGADFLSVLMQSPALRQAYKDLSTTEIPSVSRLVRSTPHLEDYDFSQIATNQFTGSTEQKSFSDQPNYNTTEKSILTPLNAQPPVINSQTVRVPPKLEPYVVEVTTLKEQNALLGENPSILSSANKGEFTIGEGETITFPNYLRGYSDKVESLTSSNHGVTQSQSVIYHNSPTQTNDGSSISYSNVIQALPKRRINWSDENQLNPHGERKERHYDINSTSNENKIERNENKYKNRPSVSWEKPEQPYTSTERNWEIPEKVYGTREKPYSTPSTRATNNQHFPIIYGKPEENYEVDEAVSVMSSGRVHGVQSSNKSDNQKVGYVVEGRNYRKYRVEERTSDGFIVGEYGVVSHDDGSLRGVRYTADGTINPRIVYDALMKFLSL